MRWLRSFLRDPLFHFLAVGGLLFGVFYLVQGPQTASVDNKTIVVEPSKLLTFMQYESMAFQPKYFKAKFDAMTLAQRKQLVEKYVNEEALYREAKVLGLSEGDYVIRRRMVQKMLYLLDDTATESFSPTKAQLRAYFLKHKNRYEVAPSLTFTHVFVDKEIKRPEGAKKYAERLLKLLQDKHAGFNDAPAYGDRFPYLQNYIQRDPDYIKNQLGAGFEEAVMKLKPSDHVWYGPIKSQFGYHLVMITAHKPAYLPKLSTVHEEVTDDLRRDTIAAYRDKAVADLVARFKVKMKGISLTASGNQTAEAGESTGAAVQ